MEVIIYTASGTKTEMGRELEMKLELVLGRDGNESGGVCREREVGMKV